MSGDAIDAATLRGWLAQGRPVWLVHAGVPSGFREAHLPGAICFVEPAHAAAVLHQHELIVVYGDRTDRSRAASFAAALLRLGFDRTHHLDGGIDWLLATGGAIEGRRA